VVNNIEFLQQELAALRPALPAGRATELEAAVGEALHGAGRVGRIVRDLLTTGRPGERAGPVDVERVLDLCASMAAVKIRSRALLVKEYAGVPLVKGDTSRLSQVFLHLLVNAAQAIPEGRPGEHVIRITTRREGDRVAVVVRDTGAGMTPEVRDRVSEPFFTTRPIGSGKGLGLSTSLGIVRAAGGEMAVESEAGKGSAFTVTLPVAPPEALEARPEPRPGSWPVLPRRGRVLVIDDEPLVVAAMARALAPEHDVLHAPEGATGLEQIASGGPFDAILCDLTMPGMSGVEVHEQVRRRDPALAARMIFMTGGAFTPVAERFLAASPNLVIEKPVRLDMLREILRGELSRECREATAGPAGSA
jgi:CheY-like chemotaxis protein/anti-sigma regulatory factor (Ser/Thr protein kinase)